MSDKNTTPTRRTALKMIGLSAGAIAGFSTPMKADNESPLWQSEFPEDDFAAKPVAILDGDLFAIAGSSGVARIDSQTGEEKWVNNEYTDLNLEVVGVNRTLFTTNDNPQESGFTVVAFDIDQGDEVWTTHIDDQSFVTGISAAKEYVYVLSDSKITVLEVPTGHELWSKSIDVGRPDTTPLAYQNYLYIAGDETISAFHRLTGEKLWEQELNGNASTSTPTVSDGNLFVSRTQFQQGPVLSTSTDEDGASLYSLNPHTGEINWQTDPIQAVKTTPTVVDGDLYIGVDTNSGRKVRAYDAASGELNWETIFTEIGSGIEDTIKVVGDLIFVGVNQVGNYAINKNTGDLEWQFTPQETAEPDFDEFFAYGRRAIIKDGVLYGGGKNFYAVETPTSESESGSVAKQLTHGHIEEYSEAKEAPFINYTAPESSLEITAPGDGDTITGNFTLNVSKDGFSTVPGDEPPADSEGYLVVLVDEPPVGEMEQIHDDNGETVIHLDDGTTQLDLELAEGEYELAVQAVDTDGLAYNLSDTVLFTVDEDEGEEVDDPEEGEDEDEQNGEDDDREDEDEDEDEDEEDIIEFPEYRDDGEYTTDGLRRAINDWREDEIDTDELRAVIDLWRR